MLKEMKWVSKVDIIVPVVGGRWDGSDALCRNLEPGRVMTLAEERYVMAWVKGQPRLIPAPAN